MRSKKILLEEWAEATPKIIFKKCGITQEQTAEHFGYDVRTLQRNESGK